MEQLTYSTFFNKFEVNQKWLEDDIKLEGFLQRDGYQRNSFKIILKENVLVIEERVSCEEFLPIYWLPLSSKLKFQRLTEIREPLNEVKVIGFSLINTQNQIVHINLHFPELGKVWVKYLGLQLNEVGFSQYYRIEKSIDAGGSATVYQVIQKMDGQHFAAKFFSREDFQNKDEIRAAMEGEINILRTVEHENIIKFYGVYQEEQGMYVILQYLEGGNLMNKAYSEENFSLSKIQKIMRGIAKGLTYLHQLGIAHRDIKLENILFRYQDSYEPVIVDFGLAVFVEQQPYASYICGTPGTISPQILKMKKEMRCNPVCDIFSAGVVLHVLLTKCFLFQGETLEDLYLANYKCKINFNDSLYKELDPEAFYLLVKMLMKKPQTRITALEMLEDDFLRIEDDCSKMQLTPPTEDGDQYFF